jgi:hypothetical protein
VAKARVGRPSRAPIQIEAAAHTSPARTRNVSATALALRGENREDGHRHDECGDHLAGPDLDEGTEESTGPAARRALSSSAGAPAGWSSALGSGAAPFPIKRTSPVTGFTDLEVR